MCAIARRRTKRERLKALRPVAWERSVVVIVPVRGTAWATRKCEIAWRAAVRV
jgi:hypothetical protein